VNDVAECLYAERFKLWEKVCAKISFNAMAIVGIIGIALDDWLWATFLSHDVQKTSTNSSRSSGGFGFSIRP